MTTWPQDGLIGTNRHNSPRSHVLPIRSTRSISTTRMQGTRSKPATSRSASGPVSSISRAATCRRTSRRTPVFRNCYLLWPTAGTLATRSPGGRFSRESVRLWRSAATGRLFFAPPIRNSPISSPGSAGRFLRLALFRAPRPSAMDGRIAERKSPRRARRSRCRRPARQLERRRPPEDPASPAPVNQVASNFRAPITNEWIAGIERQIFDRPLGVARLHVPSTSQSSVLASDRNDPKQLSVLRKRRGHGDGRGFSMTSANRTTALRPTLPPTGPTSRIGRSPPRSTTASSFRSSSRTPMAGCCA